MDIDKLDMFGKLLSFITDIRELIEMGDDRVKNDLSGLNIDEDTEMYSLEYLLELPYIISYDFDDDGNTLLYLSSRDTTEYYRLAKKIGSINGRSRENNEYIQCAINYDIDIFNGIRNMGWYDGSVSTSTKHKFGSGWKMYLSYEFCGHWELYFAIRKIFQHYKNERIRLRRIYHELISQKEMEVAA